MRFRSSVVPLPDSVDPARAHYSPVGQRITLPKVSSKRSSPRPRSRADRSIHLTLVLHRLAGECGRSPSNRSPAWCARTESRGPRSRRRRYLRADRGAVQAGLRRSMWRGIEQEAVSGDLREVPAPRRCAGVARAHHLGRRGRSVSKGTKTAGHTLLRFVQSVHNVSRCCAM